MLVGYARTSTVEQNAGLEAQVRDLESAGCEKVYREQVSSVAVRLQMDEALRFVREGDVLMVTKPDRLARSTRQLLEIAESLGKRGVGLTVLAMGREPLNSKSPTSKLLLTMLGAIAEFEREIMLERQREGIAAAAAAGKYKGRAPTARAKADQVMRLAAQGQTREAIARELKIGLASVYRILSNARTQRAA